MDDEVYVISFITTITLLLRRTLVLRQFSSACCSLRGQGVKAPVETGAGNAYVCNKKINKL